MKKIKISELPLCSTLKGLFTIGTDSQNRSVKVSLQFVEDKTNTAVANAETATAAANTAKKNADTATANAQKATENAVTATKQRCQGDNRGSDSDKERPECNEKRSGRNV